MNYIYEKLRLLTDCDFTRVYLFVRQYVIDGLADPVLAAVLTVQPPEESPQAFIRLAEELQQTITRGPLEPTAKLETCNASLRAEEGTTATSLVVTEDMALDSESPYHASDPPLVCSVQTWAFHVEPPSTWTGSKQLSYPECRRPPSCNRSTMEGHQNPTQENKVQTFDSSVGDEVLPEHHQDTGHQLDDISLRIGPPAHRSSLSQNRKAWRSSSHMCWRSHLPRRANEF